jgi:hypothetical protein
MTAVSEPAAEREIDLAQIARAVVPLWWVIAAGLVIGALVGGLYAYVRSGGSTYTATALIAPAQAFSPSGSTAVLTYLSSQLAINELATDPATVDEAAAKAGISPDKLDGHIETLGINQPEGAQPNGLRNAVLVKVIAELPKPAEAEAAADAVAKVLQRKTTSRYIRQSLQLYTQRLANYKARIVTLQKRIAALNDVLDRPKSLQAFDRLVLVSQLDQSEASLGATLDAQTNTQQALTLAQTVEQTQIIQQAKAEKTVGASHRNSIVVGAVIGLIIGAIVAVILATRASRARPA